MQLDRSELFNQDIPVTKQYYRATGSIRDRVLEWMETCRQNTIVGENFAREAGGLALLRRPEDHPTHPGGVLGIITESGVRPSGAGWCPAGENVVSSSEAAGDEEVACWVPEPGEAGANVRASLSMHDVPPKTALYKVFRAGPVVGPHGLTYGPEITVVNKTNVVVTIPSIFGTHVPPNELQLVSSEEIHAILDPESTNNVSKEFF